MCAWSLPSSSFLCLSQPRAVVGGTGVFSLFPLFTSRQLSHEIFHSDVVEDHFLHLHRCPFYHRSPAGLKDRERCCFLCFLYWINRNFNQGESQLFDLGCMRWPYDTRQQWLLLLLNATLTYYKSASSLPWRSILLPSDPPPPRSTPSHPKQVIWPHLVQREREN